MLCPNTVGAAFGFLAQSRSVCAMQAVALIGEFNNWDPQPEHWAFKNEFGVWSLFLPDTADGTSAIPHRYVRHIK